MEYRSLDSLAQANFVAANLVQANLVQVNAYLWCLHLPTPLPILSGFWGALKAGTDCASHLLLVYSTCLCTQSLRFVVPDKYSFGDGAAGILQDHS